MRVKSQKLEWKATSKIGSLDNVKHQPGGGSVKIFDEKYTPRTPSPTNTPTPSKSGSLTPTTDARENGDAYKRSSSAARSEQKSSSTAVRVSTASYGKRPSDGGVNNSNVSHNPKNAV